MGRLGPRHAFSYAVEALLESIAAAAKGPRLASISVTRPSASGTITLAQGATTWRAVYLHPSTLRDLDKAQLVLDKQSHFIEITRTAPGPMLHELATLLDHQAGGLCLEASPKSTATTILTTDRGLPWDPKGNGFRAAWREACAKAEVQGVTFHDLRGTFATRRMADGWTTEDVALCTGHSLRDLASLERYVSRAGVAAKRAEAMAQRMSKAEK